MQAKQHPNASSPILILGATGKTGRRVAQRLQTLGLPVRLGSRNASPSFDWDNPSTWPEVVRGVRSVYITYQPDISFPGAAEAVGAFAKVAVENGAKRLVLLSGRGEEGAERGEQAIQAAGVEWTIVQASFFAQNFSEGFFVDQIRGGEVAFPAGNVGEPFIDIDDIADLVVDALTQDRHVGQLYEVTGPRLLTFADATAEISKATGRDIRYISVTGEEYTAALVKEGLPPELASELTALFTSVLDGRNARLSNGIQRALGRPARDFTAFAKAAAASGAWS
jgi:uncharacterized protein YbjT (DUF2867 family)